MVFFCDVCCCRLEDEEGRECSELYLLEEDEYRLLNNGSLLHIDYEVMLLVKEVL
jgi:hypothetical protein